MLKYDCSHFSGDHPCIFNKEYGLTCNNCDHYKPIGKKILIIKLDAIGDVLRTTSILKPLRNKYPNYHISWCTRRNAYELFYLNNLVDEVITVEDEAIVRLAIEYYDIVINLDTSKISSSIAAYAMGNEKIGYFLNKQGYVTATSEAANTWLEMSAFDQIKADNKKSYQQLMYEILELEDKIEEPVFNLNNFDQNKLQIKLNLNNNYPVIGLNTGVGPKWVSKGWPLNNWEKLVQLFQMNKFNILILGGPYEKERNKYLCNKYDFLTETGCDNSVYEFAELINLCDVLITADTFATHIGTALKKYIIGLFGPTSLSEIYLYGRGIKLKADDECKCFYKKNCNQETSCMEKIKPERVYESAINILSNIKVQVKV
ncbi:MAG: glycosyltransferase family 9 protein [Bacteroidetes bacterium]|nr:glycosyltransferase family 9 protein [Bacteroidota bacterium]